MFNSFIARASSIRRHSASATRRIFFNDESLNVGFVHNEVITSKYTVLNFCFKNLYEQFQKLSNVYFLTISILQAIPSISTTNGIPTLLFPLLFVLTVNAIKDAVEDLQRHKSDRLENGQECYTIPKNFHLSEEPSSSMSPVCTYTEDDKEGRGGATGSKGYDRDEDKGFDISLPSKVETGRDVLGLTLHEQEASDRLQDDIDLPRGMETGVQATSEVEQKPFEAAFEPDASYRERAQAQGSRSLVSEVSTATDPFEALNLVKKQWTNVKVGDMILCKNLEGIPADMVLLASSDPNRIVFIESASLDGETNLKIRQPHAGCFPLFGSELVETLNAVSKVKGNIECDLPNKNLGTFNGTINLDASSITTDPQESMLISAQQVLMRGCNLRNTAWAIGVVVYTGCQTKIQMNSIKASRKLSNIERFINKLIVLIWCLQIFLCLVGAIATGILSGSNSFYNRKYLGFYYSLEIGATAGVINFFTWLTLTINMVPISLIVTMGLIKFVQGYIIMKDEDMFFPPTGTYTVARTTDLNEDLGQVHHVFSDKTGTLTCNIMKFKRCCIRSLHFNFESSGEEEGRLYPTEDAEGRTNLAVKNAKGPRFLDVKVPTKAAPSPLIIRKLHPGERSAIKEFVLNMALNHSVISEYDNKGKMRYSSSSPDEGAFVTVAKQVGIKFTGRTPVKLQLSLPDMLQYEAEILNFFEFTSERKRTTLICRLPNPENPSESRIVLYCKGADVVMKQRLASWGSDEAECFHALSEYAKQGLRTLCFAYKDLTEQEYLKWHTQYILPIAQNIVDRQEALDGAADVIERELNLLGVSGVEDKLQDEVQDTIKLLRKGGIKIWMLTGDKVETAINIGVSANLIQADSFRHIFVIDDITSKDQLIEVAENSIKKICALKQQEEMADLEAVDAVVIRSENSLITDSECLAMFLSHEVSDQFYRLTQICDAVICSRATPAQKGAVVNLIKKKQRRAVTLAIGDGGNDCNMIQQAHVGVGIRGKEGLNAFNVSDYGISQFKDLKYLILVHGRYSYYRIAPFVLYMFYKNIVLVFPLFYYAVVSLFSAQKIYFEFLYQMYNIFFTAFPIMIYGVLDCDIDKNLALKYPQLYRTGQRNELLNFSVFIAWLCNGAWHAFTTFFINLIILGGVATPTFDASYFDMWKVGISIFLSVLIVVNIKVMLMVKQFNWILPLGIALSVFSFFFLTAIFSYWLTLGSTIIGTFSDILYNLTFYISVLLSVVASLVFDWIFKATKILLYPDPVDIIQKIHYTGESLESLVHKSILAPELKALGRLASIEPASSSADALPRKSVTSSLGYAFSEADPQTSKIFSHYRQRVCHDDIKLMRSNSLEEDENLTTLPCRSFSANDL